MLVVRLLSAWSLVTQKSLLDIQFYDVVILLYDAAKFMGYVM
jgi:hypothetical protein